jgi:hypothetical protein
MSLIDDVTWLTGKHADYIGVTACRSIQQVYRVTLGVEVGRELLHVQALPGDLHVADSIYRFRLRYIVPLTAVLCRIKVAAVPTGMKGYAMHFNGVKSVRLF